MTLLSTEHLRDGTDLPGVLRVVRGAIDGLRQIVNGGMRVRDQFGRQVIDLQIDTGELPIDVEIKATRPPTGVLLLRAILPREGGYQLSGGVVTWEWRGGSLRIKDLSALSATTRYDCTILVLE